MCLKRPAFRASMSAVGALAVMLSLIGASLGSTATSGAATPSSAWSKVVANANNEGSVVFYSDMSQQQMTKFQAAFQRQYPQIKLTYQLGATSVLETEANQAQSSGNGGPDVINHTDID